MQTFHDSRQLIFKLSRSACEAEWPSKEIEKDCLVTEKQEQSQRSSLKRQTVYHGLRTIRTGHKNMGHADNYMKCRLDNTYKIKVRQRFWGADIIRRHEEYRSQYFLILKGLLSQYSLKLAYLEEIVEIFVRVIATCRVKASCLIRLNVTAGCVLS